MQISTSLELKVTTSDDLKMSTPPHDKHSANTTKPVDALEHVYCSYFKNSRNKSCHNLARWCQSARAKFPEFCKTHKLNTHTFDWFAGRGGYGFDDVNREEWDVMIAAPATSTNSVALQVEDEEEEEEENCSENMETDSN